MSEIQSKDTKEPTKNWYDPILDWIKQNITVKAVEFIMLNGGAYIAAKYTGVSLWFAKLLWNYIAKPAGKAYINYKKLESDNKEFKEKYEAVINNPNATDQDFIDAGDDFFNRPRP